MKLEDKNGYRKVKLVVLAGLATATIFFGVIALVLKKTSFLPSSSIQPTTAPSLSPTTKHDDEKHHTEDNHDDDDDDDDDD